MSNKGKIYLTLIILAVVAVFFLIRTSPDQTAIPPVPTPTPTNSAIVCIQVITPARNPQTAEIKDFPTPCDVPEGWEKL